ncbi:TRAP transporter large permease [Ramlibacter ginsenosidimutans]|uniref:TRAP transporter large permease protein n=1 Tax=Ramlibacter ginsenosidimutans TaxID=502333 RepID=A0A934TT53_9BURK|nr:TRAP transporter large permease [Ramlibacter ginsenosidimutans]MBK6007092.1 TRAP transporter large permease [Ramlibacter ginsenosidimutans]
MWSLGMGALLIGLGVPVAVCIGLAATLALAFNSTPLLVIPQQLFANLNNFSLLAIPFFMLTGAIMDSGGVSKRIIDFSQALVGFMRGGIGHVTIVASMFFADLSGSATADTAAIGSVMIPGMVRKGYAAPFAVALQSAAGSLGLLSPVSMSMLVYAYTANVSVGTMFVAGIIPMLLVVISFMAVNYGVAVRRNYTAVVPFSWTELWATFKQAFLALLTPLIILGGILGGIFTPVEAGVVAAVYVTLVSAFVFKTLTLSHFKDILTKTAVNTTRVSFLLGLAFVLGRYMIEAQIPATVAANFLTLTASAIVLLILINLFLICAHTVLETISSIVVVIPVFMPLVSHMGIDPVVFGVIVLINSAIGINLPPIGFCLFTAASIGGVSVEKATRAILPFIAALVLDLALIVAFPSIPRFLPNLMGMH